MPSTGRWPSPRASSAAFERRHRPPFSSAVMSLRERAQSIAPAASAARGACCATGRSQRCEHVVDHALQAHALAVLGE
jgi:hypothetical protein